MGIETVEIGMEDAEWEGISCERPESKNMIKRKEKKWKKTLFILLLLYNVSIWYNLSSMAFVSIQCIYTYIYRIRVHVAAGPARSIFMRISFLLYPALSDRMAAAAECRCDAVFFFTYFFFHFYLFDPWHMTLMMRWYWWLITFWVLLVVPWGYLDLNIRRIEF